MNFKTQIGCFFIATLLIISCQKDSEKFDPYGDSGQVENLINRIDNSTESFLILGNKDQSIVTKSELIVKIPSGGIVDENDIVVNGEVKLKVKNIVSAGHSVLTGSSTKVNTNIFGSNTLVEIRVTDSDDKSLYIAKDKQIEILHPINTTIEEDKLKMFNSISEEGNNVLWGEIDDPLINNSLEKAQWEEEGENGSIIGSGYRYVIENFGWFSIGDYVKTESNNNTKLCLDLPELFNKNNTKVFFVLKNFISVVNLQPFEETTSTFCGLIVKPEVMSASCIITLSSTENGDFYLGYLNNPNISESIIEIVPEKTSLDKISQFLYER